MKCFTFTGCQIKEGLKMVEFSPPNGMRMKRKKEVLLLGSYGERSCNIARHIHLAEKNPAVIETVIDSGRIIPTMYNDGLDMAGKNVVRCVMTAFPTKDTRQRVDASSVTYPVLSAPAYADTNNILVRIKTFSYENEIGRDGGWEVISGRPVVISAGKGREAGNTWFDDLIVMHNSDTIKVVTMGSEPVDDHILINLDGKIAMTPVACFSISGRRRTRFAEELESEMNEEALARQVSPEIVAS